jgi:hypothetical protein
MPAQNDTPSLWKTVRPFVMGGASGLVATVVIQPIDMIKVQKQLAEGALTALTGSMRLVHAVFCVCHELSLKVWGPRGGQA